MRRLVTQLPQPTFQPKLVRELNEEFGPLVGISAKSCGFPNGEKKYLLVNQQNGHAFYSLDGQSRWCYGEKLVPFLESVANDARVKMYLFDSPKEMAEWILS